MPGRSKIAILINTLNGGGSERVVSHLLRNLRDDYEVHLILFKNEIEYDLPEGQIISILDKGSRGRTNILKLPMLSRRLIKYCNKNEIGLVLSLLHRPNFVACIAKKLGLKAKVLVSERTYTPLNYREDSLAGKIANRLISALYPLADAVLPNSTATLKVLQDHYRVRNDYVLIKNPLDLDDIREKQGEPVDDVTFDRFTFVHVGSFNQMKGHLMLVDAFSRLGSDKAQMLFIGKGVQTDKVKQKVAALGLEESVFILGHKTNPFKYLSKADCFVFGSEFEGFPNALLEALACGLPIISTDCLAGPRELLSSGNGSQGFINGVERGEHGLLVRIGDSAAMAKAMSEMMSDADLRNDYKATAFNKSEEYDRVTVMQEFKQIIEKYLGENNGPLVI